MSFHKYICAKTFNCQSKRKDENNALKLPEERNRRSYNGKIEEEGGFVGYETVRGAAAAAVAVVY